LVRLLKAKGVKRMNWDPLAELERMRDRMNKMMDEMEVKYPVWKESAMSVMDMWQQDSSLIVEMEMPGLDKEDINLKATVNSLLVTAEKKKIKEQKKEGLYRSERRWKSYRRSSSLPVKIKPEDIKAEYENGILKVKAPLAESEKKKEKKVKIEVK
jgi:HSP20 family protein